MGGDKLAPALFGSWDGGCRYAFFTRHGGVSQGAWASLNVGRRVGDTDLAVAENRRRVRQRLGLAELLSARQVHGCGISRWDGPESPVEEVADCDALLSNRPGLGLMVQQADCQAVLLFDPRNRAIAAVHCGWRGSVQGIIGQTVAAMAGAYGSDPAELLAAISPSLGPCCAEFVNHRQELPAEFLPFRLAADHFDFWQISAGQLQAAGVQAGRIRLAGVCTSCNDDYFSYRRSCRDGDGRTGRHCSVIVLDSAAPCSALRP
jgi:polyphenol oxidase